jgi:peptidoglycan/LPS O-acetylase OafA/YrhL
MLTHSQNVVLEPALSRRSEQRLQFLDVIRGLAALAVVLEHGSERLFPGYLKASNSYFTLGVFGVSTFFLVSGFIIPVSMERHGSLSSFWQARFFRLYPMYWFSIFAVLAFGWVVSAGLPSMFGTHLWRGVLANMTMFQTFLGVPNLSGLYWTLTMEMIFYLLCSGLFLVGLLSRTLVWVWTAAIANLAATLGLAVCFHRSLPAGRTALIISAFFGTLVYRLYRGSVGRKAILQLAPLLALSLLCGFWFRFHQFPSSEKDDAFRFLGVSLSYLGAYLLFGMLYLRRHKTFPFPLLWLGRISYSLYLLHGFAFALIPAGEYPLLRLGLGALAAVVLASGTFLAIERPALALQRRLTRSERPIPTPSRAMSATN